MDVTNADKFKLVFGLVLLIGVGAYKLLNYVMTTEQSK